MDTLDKDTMYSQHRHSYAAHIVNSHVPDKHTAHLCIVHSGHRDMSSGFELEKCECAVASCPCYLSLGTDNPKHRCLSLRRGTLIRLMSSLRSSQMVTVR